MKRSEINRILKESTAFINKMNFRLPPFAFWSPDEWRKKDRGFEEIKRAMMGWDITDFGSGDFERIGLLMFTIRNGCLNDERFGKPYAEKLLIANENQVTPYHYHYQKMEDIINRGGGNLIVKLYNKSESDGLDDAPVTVMTDGYRSERPAGCEVRLTPGESITLPCGLYHSFWGEGGFGKVLVGEVSKVNDDRTDNRFLEPTGRFPVIEEDEPPLYLLCNEYGINAD